MLTRIRIRKIRGDSAILRLTNQQQDTLVQWMSEMRYIDALERAAKPIGDGGFGIRFHKTSLVRFIKRHRQQQAADAADFEILLKQSLALRRSV